MTRILSQKTKDYNLALRSLTEFYSQDTKKLITYLYKHGRNESDIARILGVTRQAVNLSYPIDKLLQEDHDNA